MCHSISYSDNTEYMEIFEITDSASFLQALWTCVDASYYINNAQFTQWEN